MLKYLTHTLDFTYYTTLLNEFQTTTLLSNYDSTLTDISTNLTDSFSVFHTSVPNVKLYYPEPFIATPTFVHDDLWFLHIVIYQYWLWFLFIYMIIFFFLAFLVTVRWCNIRHKPIRETRGVSRSKCGDLITATVPVSWATSIIIHESTDAIEFNDGFGSTEMAVGIRAYQWGWEYYYPKDMDLMLRTNDTRFIGNSLKNDLTTGKIPSFYNFKNNYKSSDFNTPVVGSNFHTLLSLNSPETVNLLSNFNFGNNKLIARKATNLITTQKVLNLDSLFISASTETQKNNNFLNVFNNSNFTDTYPTKPLFKSNQLVFCTPYSSFKNSLNFINQNDMRSCYAYWGNWQSSIINSKFNINEFSYWNRNLINTDQTPFLTTLTTVLQPTTESLTTRKLFTALLATRLLNSSTYSVFSLIADQDFKRWTAFELIEDLLWQNQTNIVFKNLQTEETQLIDSFRQNFSETLLYSLAAVNNSLTNDEFLYGFSFLIKNDNKPLNFIKLDDYINLIQQDWFYINLNGSYLLAKQMVLFLTNYSTTNFIFKNTLLPKTINSLDWLFLYNLNTPFFLQTLNDTLFKTGLVFNQQTDILHLAKNTSTFFGAFWKIFKSTIEEERSEFNYLWYSNTDFKLPVVSQNMPSLLSLLQKNNKGFFLNQIVLQQKLNLNTTGTVFNNLWSVFALPFPFSLSFESDVIRYSWFDWYAVRNTVITKAMDTSVFNLHGAKDYDFSFVKQPNLALINKSENFFLKYQFIRKLFIPVYTYSPFFFNRFVFDFKFNNLLSWNTNESFCFFYNSIGFFKQVFIFNSFFKNSLVDFNLQLTGNFSNTVSALKNFTGSVTLTQNQTEALTVLFDILAKKEYLMKSLVLTNNPLTQPTIIHSLKPSLQNPIVKLLRSVLLTNETLNDFSFKNVVPAPVFFFKPYLQQKSTESVIQNTVLRSQYQPLRKGIVNMIRIQADRAIAMPTDTRLQILAVSKDIIHSWAIPSAGIKIDCIPGYSSHRVAIFTLSGIYWGQCMEICGRFHHWMPIVVYFMRRDLFCLWCVHFVFKNKQTNSTTQATELDERDTTLLVSLTSNNWSREF